MNLTAWYLNLPSTKIKWYFIGKRDVSSHFQIDVSLQSIRMVWQNKHVYFFPLHQMVQIVWIARFKRPTLANLLIRAQWKEGRWNDDVYKRQTQMCPKIENDVFSVGTPKISICLYFIFIVLQPKWWASVKLQ